MNIDYRPYDSKNPALMLLVINSEHLDASNVKQFKAKLDKLDFDEKDVLLDMSPLAFVDSSGLGAILAMRRNIIAKNGSLNLFGLTTPVRALFELVKMHRVFAIFNTKDEVLKVLKVGS